MNTNPKIHLIEIPIAGNEGHSWNRLHSEREDICEAILKDYQSMDRGEGEADSSCTAATKNWHRELLQARLRKIDDALDRLMSGSYGNCSKCGQGIDDTKLELDPAIAFCVDCWEREQRQIRSLGLRQDSNPVVDSIRLGAVQSELLLETLQPFDTILIRTHNSDYRILLLDPKTGRALIDGGAYLTEPREGVLSGSTLNGSFKLGSIVNGQHLLMWIDERAINTSRVQSISVKPHDSAVSVEAITATVH